MNQAITGANVFDGSTLLQNYAVIIDGSEIVATVPEHSLPTDIDRLHLDGGVLAPGFIDLQVNGGGGVLFNNHVSLNTLRTMVHSHRAGGTTAMLPTLISDRWATQRAGIEAVVTALAAAEPGIVGIHIEGPFFSLPRRGAHQASYIRKLQQSDIDRLTAINRVPMIVTLAPECTEAGQIQQLVNAGIRVCAGHSDGSFADIQCALAEGLSGFTHLFNAMTGLQSREPGVVGAALADRHSWCGIIADGHHVHPATIAIAHAAKADHKLFLVTDAMATVGSDQPAFELYGETVREHGGRLINAEGRLAGSAIRMIDAVKICVTEVGLELGEVLRMASLYPAQFIRQDHHRGAIKAGFQADLVHFNDHYKVLHNWIAGECLSY